MRLRSLSVSDFGAIEQASVTFADGLNVLHGPNDLGKSTLAAAIRAALLLQHGSSAARPFIPWGTPRKPTVTLTFELDGRYWRVHKVFGTSSGGKSVLSWSNDGEQFSTEEEGRGVDGRLRQLLGWGLAAPGGRGGSHGFPKSFLATVLLGEQALPYRLLDQSLEADAEDTGKARLIEALQAMATDPLYQHVLEHAQARVDEAFTAKGKRSTRKGSPFERVTADIKQRRTASEELTRQVADSDAVVSRLGELSARRDAQLSTRAAAAERMAAVDEALAVVEARAALQAEVDAAEAALAEIERNRDEIAKLHASRREAEAAVPAGQATLEQAGAALEQARTLRDRTQAAVEALASGEDEASRTETHALRERLRTLDEAATALEDTRARIEAWAQAEAAAATATEALERATQTASASAAAVVEATAAVEQAGRRKDGLVDASRWAEAEALRGKLEALAAAERDAETARKAVGALRARAEALRTTLCEDFPDAAERQAMQGAWQALALAKAALGGGVRVSLDLTVPVVASSDGAPSRDVDPKGRLDADRAVVLELEGVGSINVEAGDPSAHAAADDAATAWAPHAQRLEALGLANVDALRAAATVRGETEAEAASLEREADVAEAGVQAPTAQARVELEQALAS
ncbi:MAG: AAA family ATPase, partial [Myxococcota bacterium]